MLINNVNGVTTVYTYNLANMLKTLITLKGEATTLSSYSYTYQLDGNQTSKKDQSGKTTTYVYDGLGRLTSESEQYTTTTPPANATIINTNTYDYDASNNRVNMTSYSTKNGVISSSSATSYVYDANNRLTTTTETAGTTVTTTYTYDNNGNTLTKTAGGTSEVYQYDVMNRMVYSSANGATATYKYRADGLRYSKTASGVETAHIWDGSNIIGDVVNGAVNATYVRGINLIAAKAGSTFTYYLYNGHGDVTGLANSSGTVTKSYDYDAFGNEKNPDPNDQNNFRYCGEYYDKETKTVYLRSRLTARMLTEDTVRSVSHKMMNDTEIIDPLSLNLYAYCESEWIAHFNWNYHFFVLK